MVSVENRETEVTECRCSINQEKLSMNFFQRIGLHSRYFILVPGQILQCGIRQSEGAASDGSESFRELGSFLPLITKHKIIEIIQNSTFSAERLALAKLVSKNSKGVCTREFINSRISHRYACAFFQEG